MAETTKGMNLISGMVNPQGVEAADIAVFIPSYEEANNIALPTRKASAGIQKFYPDLVSVIVNCDNNSSDGTKDAFFQAECDLPRIYVSTPPGLRGKGANLANAIQMAANLSAKVVVIVDANLLSIKTTWFKSLIDPILCGSAEYVSPLYVRHRYDSPISQNLVYPLLRTLFGRRVLQPISVDHAFSGRLNEIFLNSGWAIDDRGYKSDLKLLSAAIMNGAPVCQSFMAYPRISTPDTLDHNLPKAFGYVARALFDLTIETWDFWKHVKRSRPTIMSVVDETPLNPAPIVEVDRQALIGGFVDLGLEYQEVWKEYFPGGLTEGLQRELAIAAGGGTPTMPAELWSQAVFAVTVAYKKSGEEVRTDLIKSLSPLFLAKALTAHTCASGMNERQYNALLECEALSFEAGKANLVSRWADDC